MSEYEQEIVLLVESESEILLNIFELFIKNNFLNTFFILASKILHTLLSAFAIKLQWKHGDTMKSACLVACMQVDVSDPRPRVGICELKLVIR